MVDARLGILLLSLAVAGAVGGLAYGFASMGLHGPTSGGGVAAGHGEAVASTQRVAVQERNTTTATMAGRGPHQHGPHTGMGNATMTANATGGECIEVAGAAPGELINTLFDNHNQYTYELYTYPENLTIVWVISGPSHEAVETLVKHIEQMECIIENGGTPRPHDPLFVVDAQITREYVDTTINWLNDTAVEIVKTAENQCAYQVILLHAEVVKGFFDEGRAEAAVTHEVPEEVLELCQPYLEDTATTGQ